MNGSKPADWTLFNIQQMEKLDPLKIEAAVNFLRADLKESAKEQIRAEIAKDSETWWVPYHFSFGMRIRNELREKGFGEGYFGVDNLDDYYAPLVEMAVREIPPSRRSDFYAPLSE